MTNHLRVLRAPSGTRRRTASAVLAGATIAVAAVGSIGLTAGAASAESTQYCHQYVTVQTPDATSGLSLEPAVPTTFHTVWANSSKATTCNLTSFTLDWERDIAGTATDITVDVRRAGTTEWTSVPIHLGPGGPVAWVQNDWLNNLGPGESRDLEVRITPAATITQGAAHIQIVGDGPDAPSGDGDATVQATINDGEDCTSTVKLNVPGADSLSFTQGVATQFDGVWTNTGKDVCDVTSFELGWGRHDPVTAVTAQFRPAGGTVWTTVADTVDLGGLNFWVQGQPWLNGLTPGESRTIEIRVTAGTAAPPGPVSLILLGLGRQSPAGYGYTPLSGTVAAAPTSPSSPPPTTPSGSHSSSAPPSPKATTPTTAPTALAGTGSGGIAATAAVGGLLLLAGVGVSLAARRRGRS